MKVIDNRAVSVYALFRKELENLYPKEEIETFLFFSFNEYFGFSRSDMVLKKDMRLSESELLKFFRVIRKLKLHVPIQYILGNTEFYGLKLKVNEHVLIPRPETEELVEWVISEARIKKQEVRTAILDIGTGSGCIAIALKKNMPDAEVYALDISSNALAVAKENGEKNNAEIHFLQGDILEFYRKDAKTQSNKTEEKNLASLRLSGENKSDILGFYHEDAKTQSNKAEEKNLAPLRLSGENKFDVIVSNPPYITEKEKPAMSANVLDHEPHTALFVPDNDALLFYRAILDFAKEKLAPSGKVYFELNSTYAAAVAELATAKGFINCTIRKDLSGKERMLRCEKV